MGITCTPSDLLEAPACTAAGRLEDAQALRQPLKTGRLGLHAGLHEDLKGAFRPNMSSDYSSKIGPYMRSG